MSTSFRLCRRHGAWSRDLLRRRAGPPQARRPPQHQPADLVDLPIVALPTESRTRRTIDAAAATAGVPLRQMVVVTQIATLLGLVGAGVGVGIVPRGATRDRSAAACVPCRSNRGLSADSA